MFVSIVDCTQEIRYKIPQVSANVSRGASCQNSGNIETFVLVTYVDSQLTSYKNLVNDAYRVLEKKKLGSFSRNFLLFHFEFLKTLVFNSKRVLLTGKNKMNERFVKFKSPFLGF